MLKATQLAVVVLIVLATTAAGQEPVGCKVVDSHGRCLVIAVDPGRPGGPRDPDRDKQPKQEQRQRSASSSKSGAPASTSPPPRVGAMPAGPGGWSVGELPDPNAFLDNLPTDRPQVPGPAVVTPEVLAQRAVERLSLTPPMPHTSIDDGGYVGVPVWLWIDGGAAFTGPVSATATAGAARVTAEGRLVGVEWSMGPPEGSVRCAGPGTPWTGQVGPSPDCGYVYELRSLPERTAGAGRWPITATSVWTVTWTGVSGGTPVDGEQTVRVSSAEASVAVGEIQVLVAGDGG